MRLRLLPTAAAFALCALALPFAANAQKVANPDQLKNVTPAAAKLPAAAAAANNKLVQLAKAHLDLKPVKAYIGGVLDLGDPVKFDTAPTTTGFQANCKIEVQIADWAPMEFWLPECSSSGPFDFHCNQPSYRSIVPESKLEGTFPLKARMAAHGYCSASAWATTTLTLGKGPTKLNLIYKKPIALPPALALLEATEEGEEIMISINAGWAPVANRGVVANVTGGAVMGQVPLSNTAGDIVFTVMHGKGHSSQVQIAFIGDSAYQPANLSVMVP